MSTNLDYNEFDHDKDEGLSSRPDEIFPTATGPHASLRDPSAYDATQVGEVVEAPGDFETNEYGVTRATPARDDAGTSVVSEGISEHRPDESLGEWLRNDLEQTKADFHIGEAHKRDS